VLLTAAAILGVDGVRHSWRLSAERSGLTRAALYLELHHARLVLTTNEVPVFYLRGSNRRCDTAKVPHAFQRLSADIRAGYSYALMDHHSWTVARFIQDHMRRVAQYPTTQTTAIGENLVAAENTHTPRGPYPIPYVDVFQLRLIGLPPPGSYTAQVCNLNVL
jgi:hypothetical protein